MTYRIILTPVFGSQGDRAALQAAFGVARTFDAHVEAMFARIDPRDAVPVLGEGMTGVLVDEIIKAAETDVASHRTRARQAFEAALGEFEGVLTEAPPAEPRITARWNEVTGRADDVVSQEGRLADLLVFGPPSGEDGDDSGLAFETALLSAGRPILYVSQKVPTTLGSHVAIAWNGRAESARAVAAAMPFLERAQTVHILTAETPITAASAGRRLVDYLRWHGIRPILTILPQASAPVGKTLTEKAQQLDCDLLVMGGYGHSRMREMILGGVTRYVFGHPSLPVLLAH